MKPNLFKTMFVTLLTMLVAMNASAQTQTYFSCNFDNYTNTSQLIGWKFSGSTTLNGNSPYRYGNSGKGLQLGTTNGANGTATTPALNTSLPSDVQLSFFAATGGYNGVSLSIANGSSKFYTYNLTGCTPSTKIKFYANRICALDNIKVTGDADPRTPVTLEYSADKHTTATESGEITGAPTLTVDPPAAASEVVFSSSNESVAKFEDGKLIAVAPGTTTITASISGSETYRDAEARYTLKVGLASSNLKFNPESATVTYGDDFTAPTLSWANGYDKNLITFTSSNENVATVDNMDDDGKVNILIKSVGVTTITASGAATPYLKASKAFFTLTVNDIQGSAVGGGTGGSVFKETFNDVNVGGTGGNDGTWSGSIASGDLNSSGDKKNVDEDGWKFTYGYGARQCARFGTGNNKGSATTRQIAVTEGQDYMLTFKAAPWVSDKSNTMSVSVNGVTISNMTGSMIQGQWNDFSATITPTSSAITITFAVTGREKRFFLDEINVVAPTTDETVEVTIPASGWGTYCCQWPLDFTAAPEGLKAYAVSATSATNVTLSEITQKLIGGTGIIINGTPGTKYTIKVADKGTAYEGTNLLTGTLAPTYVEEGQYFLKSGKFVYSSAGILPDKKAYLKSDGTGTQGAKLSFLFDTTSIEQVKVETSDAWYDLSGRKVNPSANVKGVYIHNGKKVVK